MTTYQVKNVIPLSELAYVITAKIQSKYFALNTSETVCLYFSILYDISLEQKFEQFKSHKYQV